MVPHCIMHAAAEPPILFLIAVSIEKIIICGEQDSNPGPIVLGRSKTTSGRSKG
jgi:hypothetical protein